MSESGLVVRWLQQLDELATTNFVALEVANKALCPLRHAVHVETKVVVNVLAGQAVTETPHVKSSVSESLPTQTNVRLQNDRRDVLIAAEDGSLVLYALLLEKSVRREADNASLDRKLLGDLESKVQLSTDRDESDFGILLFLNDVSTLFHAFSLRHSGLRQGLTRDRDHTRALSVADCYFPGTSDFLAVCRSDVVHVGHSAVQCCKFHGLMGRTVLTSADAVVSGNVDDWKLLQGTHAHGGRSVEVEHEEG